MTLTATQPHIHMQLQDREDSVLTTVDRLSLLLERPFLKHGIWSSEIDIIAKFYFNMMTNPIDLVPLAMNDIIPLYQI